MSENIYKQARLKAAKRNTRLTTVKDASMYLFITREKLAEIEQEDDDKKKRSPDVSDVINMVKLYNAPELLDYYCTHQCPIRQGEKPLMYNSLSEISTSLMAAIHFLNNISDSLHNVLSDSKISDNERFEFEKILNTLKDVVYSVDSLELWAKKNNFAE